MNNIWFKLGNIHEFSADDFSQEMILNEIMGIVIKWIVDLL